LSSGYNFYLKQDFSGPMESLEVSESDYQLLVKSRNILSAALSIEEKYDLVLGNFIDFEREAVLLTMDSLTDPSFDYSRAYKVLSTLNRRVANFIYFGKNYTELIPSMAAKCVEDKEAMVARVGLLRSKIYDQSIDYRFAEALRGHITHCADAVHSVTNPTRWTLNADKQADKLVFNIGIHSIKDRLRENSGFKKSVLKEVEDKIDLKRVARKYMGSISELQDQVRAFVKSSVQEAREVIEDFTEKYAAINDGEAFALAAFSQVHPDSRPLSLSLKWDDIRIGLEEKNQPIQNIDRRYLSSDVVPK